MVELVVIVVVGLFLYSRVQAVQTHVAAGGAPIVAIPLQGVNTPAQSLPPWADVQDALAGHATGFVITNPVTPAPAAGGAPASGGAPAAPSSPTSGGSSTSGGSGTGTGTTGITGGGGGGATGIGHGGLTG